MKLEDYAIRIEPLPDEDGGGFLLTVPDLPGCDTLSTNQRSGGESIHCLSIR